MCAKDIQQKEITKKIQQFLKQQSDELKSEVLNSDYLPVLVGMMSKLPPIKLEAAIKLLATDGSAGAVEQLRSVVLEASTALVAKLTAMDALESLGQSIGNEDLKNRLREMQRIAVDDDSKVAGEFAKRLSAADIEAWAAFLVEKRAAKAVAAVGAAIEDKHAQKAIKRAAYELRTKGIDVTDWVGKGESALKPMEKEEPLALSTIPDGFGKQLLIMFLYEETEATGVHVVQAMLDLKNGIDDYQAIDAARGSARSFLKRLQSDKKISLLELPVEHAAYLLDRAAARASEKGLSPPPEYARTRNHLPKSAQPYVPPDPKSLLHVEINLRDALEAVELFKSSWFESWEPDADSVNLCKMKLDQALASSLVISESQRLQQVEKAFEDSAKAFLTSENRSRLADRLTEAARLLAWNGQEKEAKWAVAVSEEVLNADAALPHFIVEMFRRLFPDLEAAIKKGSLSAPKEEKPPSSGGIIIP